MSTRAEFLRRRISIYRRYLAEGATGEHAMRYLKQLHADEAELAEFTDAECEPAHAPENAHLAHRQSKTQ